MLPKMIVGAVKITLLDRSAGCINCFARRVVRRFGDMLVLTCTGEFLKRAGLKTFAGIGRGHSRRYSAPSAGHVHCERASTMFAVRAMVSNRKTDRWAMFPICLLLLGARRGGVRPATGNDGKSSLDTNRSIDELGMAPEHRRTPFDAQPAMTSSKSGILHIKNGAAMLQWLVCETFASRKEINNKTNRRIQ